MNNPDEYIAELGRMYDKIMKERKDEDYVVNRPQMDKFVKVIRFFRSKTKELDGQIEEVRVVPKEEHSGLTATFIVFDLIGERQTAEFAEIVSYTSAVTIDANDKGEVCISLTVPNVFVPAAEAK